MTEREFMKNFRTYVKTYLSALADWEASVMHSSVDEHRRKEKQLFDSSRGSINECIHIALTISKKVGIKPSYQMLLKVYLGQVPDESRQALPKRVRVDIIDQINQTIGRCSNIPVEFTPKDHSIESTRDRWHRMFIEACAKHFVYLIVGGILAGIGLLIKIYWH